MAAPRPIKGILKNKNSATVVKTPPEEVEPEDPEHVPGLSEDEQRWVPKPSVFRLLPGDASLLNTC
ncbi:unnamed protein product [Tetraodon nigroviridis]|uniref:(spotted green pufferfish) hypothetical protein n=1 Tax=Tetraodon nigroviridis TaxID=99883 RepID=Q4RU44_TETNG|nr:unnamed protein product [Tetraodon nigroviridis]